MTDGQRSRGSWSAAGFRGLGILGIAILGGGLMAIGIVVNEGLRLPAPTLAKVAVGGSFGAGILGLPMLLAVAWRKPLVLVALNVYLPPIVAALALALKNREDLGFLITYPILYATTLMTAIIVHPRDAVIDGSTCGHCGYDLRGRTHAVCPECGAGARTVPILRVRRGVILDCALWLAGAAASAALQIPFYQWITSLG